MAVGEDIPTLTSEATEDNGAPSPHFWVSALEAAEKADKPTRDIARRAWDEYLCNSYQANEGNRLYPATSARFAVWWSAVRTVQPALYSRTPICVTEKAFDDLDDNIARVASICNERLAKYLIRSCPFDRVQYATRDDYIMRGKATNRVFFESEVTGEPGQEQIGKISCGLIPVYYYDLLHTPNARYWDEIDWIAFRAWMTKKDATARFGEIANTLNYTQINRGDKDTKRGEKDAIPTLYAEVWEIWDKKNKQVYWLDKTHADEFLDVKPDPYELIGFFPCPPFILGTCGAEDLYAVPDYAQLEALVLQIHACAERLKQFIKASQRKGVFDSSVPELADLANATSNTEFLGIKNFKELVGDKGLEGLIKFFPTKEFAAAATEMANALQLFEQKFNELWHIPDLLRGTSDPEETAAAQQLKGQFISLSFSAVQREFQRIVRDSIELMCDLAIKKMPEQKLAEIVGLQFMKPEDQQLWPQVYQLLSNDTQRTVRIDIETDSTITMNQNADIEQRNYLAKTVFEGMAAVATASQENPQFMPVAFELLEIVVGGLQKGKQVEEVLRKASIQAQQPKQEQQEPNYDGMKIQQQAQDSQINAQLKQQELALKAQDMQADVQLRARELDIKEQEVAIKAQLEGVKAQMEQQQRDFDNRISETLTELEKMKVALDEQEKYMTEARLQREHEMDRIETLAGIKNEADKIRSDMNAPKPARKQKAKIAHADGTESHIEIEG